MNINTKIKSLLNDSFFLEGDFLDLRVHNANIFMHLVAAAKNQNKIAYGIDTWSGLEAPTKKDLCISNYFLYNKGAFTVSKDSVINLLAKEMPNFTNYELLDNIPDKRFSFVVLDKVLYEPTKIALEKIWHQISYGGTIFIPKYETITFSADLAVTEFMKEKENEIIINRQLIIDGTKEKFLIIKCFNEANKPKDWSKVSKVTDKKITVAMVLKTGGSYNSDYVNALARAVKRNTTRNVEIVCLTDNPMGFDHDIKVIPFKHEYPKWWGKVELFRPDLFVGERVFYIDLDTVIVGNIDEILDFEFDFCGLRDFYKMVSLGSGLMSWNSPAVHKIYTEFLTKDAFVMSTYADGDQQWIDQHKPRTIFFQDIFSKEVVSFKKDCQKADGSIVIPPKAKIICFHGTPKPHNITNPVIKDHWKPE
jgi:hypothetical protein